MECQKLFTVTKDNFSRGIQLTKYNSVHKARPQLTDRGYIASYPLYPAQLISMQAETMLPLSLSYVLPEYNTTFTVSNKGAILQLDSRQWIPLDSEKDKSLLIDVCDSLVLLYCPAGETFYRSVDKKLGCMLEIDAQCNPKITEYSNAKLEMTALGKGFVTPSFNSEAQELLANRLCCKVGAKRRASSPLEAVLEQGPQSSGDTCTELQQEQDSNKRSKRRRKKQA